MNTQITKTPKLIQDLGTQYPNENSKYKFRYGIYECPYCKKHWRVNTASIKNGSSTKCTQCNINKITKDSKANYDTNGRLYKIFTGMKTRCYNKNRDDYKHYGKKGIKICDEWKNDFKSFYDWAIENGYQDDLTIDRKDVNGDYNPNNCRWVDKKTQSRNTRKLRSTNTSGYRGVSWHKKQQKFTSRITVNSITINLGSYCSDIEAAKAYNKYVIENNLEHTLNNL